MIDYTSVEGKANIECYTLEDLLQETLELGAKGYKLCLENDYFCFNRGGNYTAYFDAPLADEVPASQLQVLPSVVAFLATLGLEEEEALVAELEADATSPQEIDKTLGEDLISPEEGADTSGPDHSDGPEFDGFEERTDATPSDVNTAAEPPVQEEAKEQAPDTTEAPAPRRGRPPRNAT